MKWLIARSKEATTWLGLGLVSFALVPMVPEWIAMWLWCPALYCAAAGIWMADSCKCKHRK